MTKCVKIGIIVTYVRGDALSWWTEISKMARVPTTWERFQFKFYAKWSSVAMQLETKKRWEYLSVDGKIFTDCNLKFQDVLMQLCRY